MSTNTKNIEITIFNPRLLHNAITIMLSSKKNTAEQSGWTGNGTMRIIITVVNKLGLSINNCRKYYITFKHIMLRASY